MLWTFIAVVSKMKEEVIPMLANFEYRDYKDYGRVWIGRYKNLHNLPHWHLENEIIYVENSTAVVSHNDKEYLLQKGNIICIQSGQVHYIDGDKDSVVQIILFDNFFLPEVLRNCKLEHVVLHHSYDFPTVFFQILSEQSHKENFYVEKIHLLLADLLLNIYRMEPLNKEGYTNKNENLHDYKKLLKEIQKSYNEIDFSKAANIMGLSESYFSRYFHKMSGMTFSRYLNTIRVEKAIELLKEEKYSVTEISIRCGFDTIRHFNRTFKEITGRTPKQIPKNFVLYHHTTKILHDSFDPTLKESILL